MLGPKEALHQRNPPKPRPPQHSDGCKKQGQIASAKETTLLRESKKTSVMQEVVQRH